MTVAPSRILLAAVAVGLWTCGSASAADPVFDQMPSLSGPTAIQPSRGGRDIMREAERSPSLTQRFNLPQLSGPLPREIWPPLTPRNSSDLAVPPSAQPGLALRPAR
jgi:hypothetical protein